MKETGKCPKCGSSEVYTNTGLTMRSDRCLIPVTSWTRVFVNVYLCTSCGYIEEYAEKFDGKKLKKIKELRFRRP